MTRTVVATFPDAEAARRAAVALGRAELAAGPTRVQVDASAPERGARLELRVDEPDAPRAIALMREHGAAVADAVTAAMGGATASDAQLPARDDDAPPTAGRDDVGERGAPPDRDGRAREGAGPQRGSTGDEARRDAVARDAARQAREASDPPRRLGPNAEHDDPDNPDTLHVRLAPGLRRGVATRRRTGPGDAAPAASSPSHDDSAALTMQGTPRRGPSAPGTPPSTDAAGNPLPAGDEASAGLRVQGAAPAGDAPGGSAPGVVRGNAPSRGQAGTGSGTHLSDTVAAGTASSMGQVGPGTTLAHAMGATDETGTASGTRTRAEPGTLERADDVPVRDPRPPRRRPKSDA